MSRLGIRARMAATYAIALLAMLALAGLFAYVFLDRQLTESLDTGLQVRANDLASILPVEDSVAPALSAEEGFSQVLGPDGEIVLDTRGEPAGGTRVLSKAEMERALDGPIFVERNVDGVEGIARILARPAGASARPQVILVGASTDDRSEALRVLVSVFGLGSPIAVLLASLIGYLIAGRSLAPVSRMRERAAQITQSGDRERLPLPDPDDEIRRLGETLNAMLERIEAGVERERTFVADASHELRTPLAILSSELELAQKPGRTAPELEAAVASAAEEVARLTRLAEDLLIVARSGDGELPLDRMPVRLAGIAQKVAVRFEAEAARRDRRIVIVTDADPVIDADPLRIEQALSNLLANAIGHGTGTITVTVSAGAGLGRLEVRDEGPGFPAGFADSAFDRFSRADPGRAGGGAGLGLAIVAAIATAHAGNAEVLPAAGGAVAISVPLAA